MKRLKRLAVLFCVIMPIVLFAQESDSVKVVNLTKENTELSQENNQYQKIITSLLVGEKDISKVVADLYLEKLILMTDREQMLKAIKEMQELAHELENVKTIGNLDKVLSKYGIKRKVTIKQ